jgi:hypothetical protein
MLDLVPQDGRYGDEREQGGAWKLQQLAESNRHSDVPKERNNIETVSVTA